MENGLRLASVGNDKDAKFIRDGITYPSHNELCAWIEKRCAQLSTQEIWEQIKEQTAWDEYVTQRDWFKIYFKELALRATGPE